MGLISVGQYALLAAFVLTGHAALACSLATFHRHRRLLASGLWAGLVGTTCLSVTLGILAYALIVKDFRWAYVARYSNQSLSWQYSLSALWVGQAGSLLLWTWMSAIVACGFRFWSCRKFPVMRAIVFGILMAFCCFLAGTLVFAADPMEPSLWNVREGAGLSPILQHPSMLIHPPVVFLGYALWAVPFALACAGLMTAGPVSQWIREARGWMLAAWLVSGAGIALGAAWAYQELGWGGYWGWDPVENGSLLPWLLGTAAIHASMAWRHRGMLLRTTILLLVATFAACQFSTFLTRSGIFSSLHAFSQSPLGWLFLGVMAVMTVPAVMAILRRSRDAEPHGRIVTLLCREGAIVLVVVALVLLAAITAFGTISSAASELFVGRKIFVGPSFYNQALVPLAGVILIATAMAPLLNWRTPPTRSQQWGLAVSAVVALIVAIGSWWLGIGHPLIACVDAAAAFGVTAVLWSLGQSREMPSRVDLHASFLRLRRYRRMYGGFLVHLGLLGMASGIAGSSLAAARSDKTLQAGESIHWRGWEVRLVDRRQRSYGNRLIAEIDLAVRQVGGHTTVLRPARHYHRAQEEWTSEVAIDSSWRSDFYTILHGSDGQGGVQVTLIENPRMRWIWLGAWIMAGGAVLAGWPRRRAQARCATRLSDRETTSETTTTLSASPSSGRRGVSPRVRKAG